MYNKDFFYKLIACVLSLFIFPFFIFYITKPSIQDTSLQIAIYSITVLASLVLLKLLVKPEKSKKNITMIVMASIAFSLSIVTINFLLK
ncbi:hypothetical protein Pcaca03_09520 [Pectobacterium carotovorum subsp. carotovorum]|uniref:Uncharacterized protein n=1 Tax=Pectobacterium carotovorum subsp. carotovorum TaxID=555 RepID=A0AAI9PDJ1_PECCC|nr:hypothetical protein SOASR016_39480 [Pectobacterium carotovorum subsp. carotovorum]GLV68508.1 hypothetical protein Pcaca03_09520 [Pectobacterium carotovorum subsp. carotovorum]